MSEILSGDFPSVPPMLTLRPRRRSFGQLIVDRNPFYLLSAVLMFAGCRMIIGALDVTAGDTSKLLLLIGTLNVYEFLLIGLALFLIVKRGLRRDGWILLSIEALFLVDLTFLNGEVFTADLRLGAMVNLICFALALAKVGLVIRVLRLRVPWPAMAVIALQLAALFGIGGLFKEMSHNGSISALQLYGAWWAVGLLPVAAALLVRASGQAARANTAHGRAVANARYGADPNAAFPEHRSPASDPHGMAALPGRLYMVLPFIALLAHFWPARTAFYWIHFHPANLAPVLLGLAVAAGHLVGRQRPRIVRLQAILIAMAVIVSVPFHADLMAHVHGLRFSPLRWTLMAAAAALVYSYATTPRRVLAAVAGMCIGAASLGYSVDEMQMRALALARWCMQISLHLVPTTPMQWGIAAVAASFVMLGIGAAMSLRRGNSEG